MSEPTTPFVDRFTVFYDSCSAEEREVLAMLGTAAVLVRDGQVTDADVVGFQLDAGSPLQALLRESDLVAELVTRLAAMRDEQAAAIADADRG